jgi:cell division protein FtsQ
MDGGGRLVEPLARPRQSRRRPGDATFGPRASVLRHFFGHPAAGSSGAGSPLGRFAHRWLSPLCRLDAPRGSGVVATILLITMTVGYGIGLGGHGPQVLETLIDVRDLAANTAGFRVTKLALSGQRQMTREEILATAGVTGRSSLLFLDVEAARAKLKANPWIADATILKLYPDRLQIVVTEREAFALWQKDGRASVIARDGTVLEPYVARRYAQLPMVVGAGAELRANDFLGLLERYPEIGSNIRAAILVAERRWNLRLKNGMDVRLPETDVEQALAQLVTLEREKKLFTRDIVAIDLRLPDRVTVRLSDTLAKAREDALNKDKKTKKKGTDA